MPNILKNSSILITGGTGSFGKKMVETLLAKKYSIFKANSALHIIYKFIFQLSENTISYP